MTSAGTGTATGMESMDHDDETGVSLSGSKRSREDPPWGQEVEDDGLSGFPP